MLLQRGYAQNALRATQPRPVPETEHELRIHGGLVSLSVRHAHYDVSAIDFLRQEEEKYESPHPLEITDHGTAFARHQRYPTRS